MKKLLFSSILLMVGFGAAATNDSQLSELKMLPQLVEYSTADVPVSWAEPPVGKFFKGPDEGTRFLLPRFRSDLQTVVNLIKNWEQSSLEQSEVDEVYNVDLHYGSIQVVAIDEDEDIASESEFNSAPTNKYAKTLLRWVDPTTPPKTRNSCVKMCSAGPLKTCCGWKLQKQWMYRRAELLVTSKQKVELQNIVEKCLKDAAISSLVAGIASGGSAAATAASSSLKQCLVITLGSQLAGVSIKLSGGWGNWE